MRGGDPKKETMLARQKQFEKVFPADAGVSYVMNRKEVNP